jgi:hypothetical protein
MQDREQIPVKVRNVEHILEDSTLVAIAIVHVDKYLPSACGRDGAVVT